MRVFGFIIRLIVKGYHALKLGTKITATQTTVLCRCAE